MLMSQDSLNEFDRSDLEGLKQELINSIPLETYSAPISPVSGADCLESFDLVTRSAPPSPKTRPVSNIQNLISRFEREVSDKAKVLQAAQLSKMSDIKEIKLDCASLKRVCTRFLNQLKEAETALTLNSELLHIIKPKIESRIKDLENKEMELNSAFDKAKLAESHGDRKYCEELVAYMITTEKDLARLCGLVKASKPAVVLEAASESGAAVVTPDALLHSVSQIGNNPIKISVECPEFNGDERDRLEFRNWLNQFEAVIKSRTNWT